MSHFWRNWLAVWCGAVGVFGAVLVGGGLEASSGPTRLIFDKLNGPMALDLNAQMRFTLAVLGAVTLGWALTAAATIRAAILLGDRATPIWRALVGGVMVWFVIDTAMSILTGYGINAIPNLILLTTFLLPIIRSGVLHAARA